MDDWVQDPNTGAWGPAGQSLVPFDSTFSGTQGTPGADITGGGMGGGTMGGGTMGGGMDTGMGGAGTGMGGMAVNQQNQQNCPPPDPTSECFKACNQTAKVLAKRCREYNKEYVKRMKAMGCKGTTCKTRSMTKTCSKKKKACKKKKPACKKTC